VGHSLLIGIMHSNLHVNLAPVLAALALSPIVASAVAFSEPPRSILSHPSELGFSIQISQGCFCESPC
jgi:hypothetical protein